LRRGKETGRLFEAEKAGPSAKRKKDQVKNSGQGRGCETQKTGEEEIPRMH